MSNFIDDLLESPESKTLEFKQNLSSPTPLLKTLVAFANTAGGRLVIGITDDKSVLGIQHPLDEEERLANLIADSIAPRLVPKVEMVTVEGKTLLIIEVYLSSSRPHWLKSVGRDNGVTVRLGSTNRQADQPLIAELQRGVEGISYDSLPMPELSIDDLDMNAIQT
ncbi:MAG: putative DNA binding domain-containing protein, partial [Gammaproteobacteria bacterium]|nr:putative DNA binding domain-containing protein [Gammaproteobacteria bacterium]